MHHQTKTVKTAKEKYMNKWEDIMDDRPEGFVPEGMEGAYGIAYQWEKELRMHDMFDLLNKLHSPGFDGKYLSYGEDKKVKPTDRPLEEWVDAMEKLKFITRQIQIKKSAAEMLLSQVREYSRSLQSCVPLPYDMEMFELGWVYQSKFIRHVQHWSVSRIPDSIEPKAKAGYEKCCKLFHYLTEGLRTHNFSICYWDDRTTASFEFNVETVPGMIEFYFPLIVSNFGNADAKIEYVDKPMSMALGWHMHDIIPVIDKFWCYTYSLDEIKNALKSYVENAEWRNDLHKRFVKTDENGKEIELEKAPDWYETEIQKSIAKSATEKDCSKMEDVA